MYVQEAPIVTALDSWLAQLFDREHIDETCHLLGSGVPPQGNLGVELFQYFLFGCVPGGGIALPLGTAMLGYYGMEVIKVESDEVPSRGRATALHADMNRAKLGCTINLRHPEGKELFKQLVAVSDVVVDNFSAGVMERLGFSFAALQEINPRIIQVVMPGWGLTGPLRSWVAWS